MKTKSPNDNGYNLSPENSTYPSYIWFRDNTSKNSNYHDLEPGKINLGIALYTDNSKAPALTCGTALEADSAHTAMNMSINLPRRK